MAAFALGLLAAGSRAAETVASHVVVFANSDDPDSLRIARHYAEMRGVPAANIVALRLPLGETITWREFVVTLWLPLQSELIRRKWIDAIPMDLTDAVGRHRNAVSGHRISYLVVCRGVPLRIAHDSSLPMEKTPFSTHPQFRTNCAAVDSELALLAQTEPATTAFVPNPLFRNEHPSDIERRQVIKVSRLDGPTPEDANALVDRAITAERNGLVGRGYIDIGGNHAMGEQWLEATAKLLDELGFDTDVDRAPATMPASARFDAPALYFGWYSGSLNGPFALPDFQFPPGAIVLHIHSYSASTLHSVREGWCGPLLARGVTATFGNVYEPYLEMTHQPQLVLRALMRGATLGDAACYAVPAFSWQAVVIGDPLYRPFAKGFLEIWGDHERLPARLAPYAVLRRMRQLIAADKGDEAITLARATMRSAPSLPVALALADRLERNGDHAGAAQAVGFAPLLKTLRTEEWALVAQAARVLAAGGQPARAVEAWRGLFAQEKIPAELRVTWLREARPAALAAKDFQLAAKWDSELAELVSGTR